MSAVTQGIHHLGLTVPNLEQAKTFFLDALGFELVRERPDYPAAFVSDGKVLLTLWQAQTETPVSFDRKVNVGLHHFALLLDRSQNLDEIYQRLRSRDDVEIEFAPEQLAAGPARHLMCTVAGGLRLELLAP